MKCTTTLAAMLCLFAATRGSEAQQAAAQIPEPKLTALQPAGAKLGTSVDVKVFGAELDSADRLLFSHAGITATPTTTPPDRYYAQGRAVANLFKVNVAADVPPGIYEVRLAGYFGISNARRFAVGHADEIFEKEPNNTPDQAPEVTPGIVVNGACDAQNFDSFRLPLKKGQRVIVDCQAQRLDSRGFAVLRLLDPTGREVDRAVASRFRDPVLDFTAEADASYTLRVHDLTYRGGDEFVYRLSLNTGPWIDFAEPPVLKAGAENKVVLYGRNLPGGSPAEGLKIDGRALEKLEVTIAAPADASALPSEAVLRPSEASVDFVSWSLASPQGRSNAIRFLLSDAAPVLEVEPNNDPEKAQGVQPPVQVVGRFQAAGDRDGVVFEAKKGDRLWIEVVSQRLGLPTDPQIVLQQLTVGEKGGVAVKDVQEADDQPSPLPAMGGNMERRFRVGPEDPAILLPVPADGRYRVMVRDLYGSAQTDPSACYVLSVRAARPDFRLVSFPVENFRAENRVSSGATVLRRGGSARVKVLVFRREGFDGSIRLEAEGLPAGVTARSVLLGPADSSGDVILNAAADAAGFAGPLRIVGKAEVGGQALARPVRAAEVVWDLADTQRDALTTRLTAAIGLSVDDRFTSPFGAKLGDAETYRTARGGKLKIPVKLLKQADFKDADKVNVKLTPAGLPGGGGRGGNNDRPITAKEVTLTLAKPDGEIEIDVTDKAAVGSYTVTVTGDAEIPYLRNPERLKRAQDDQKRIDQVAAEVAADLKKASEAKAAAEKEVQKAASELAQVKQKGTGEAAVNQAEAKVKEAEEAKAKAADAEKKLQDLVKAGEQYKKEIADELKKAGDLAKEKKVKVWIAAPTVTLEVAAFPVSAKLAPETATVAAGGNAEVTLKLTREFGFAGDVKLDLVPPSGMPLKLAQPLTVAAAASEAKFVLEADKKAKPGTYTAILRAPLSFNGRALTYDLSFQVKVDPAAP